MKKWDCFHFPVVTRRKLSSLSRLSTSTLPDRYRLPDRGFIWYLFSQSVKEIQIMPEQMIIRYELQDEYRKPFKQFYI